MSLKNTNVLNIRKTFFLSTEVEFRYMFACIAVELCLEAGVIKSCLTCSLYVLREAFYFIYC